MRLVFDLSGTQTKSGGEPHGGGEYIKSLLVDVVAQGRDEELVFVAKAGQTDDAEVMALVGGREVRRFEGNSGLVAVLRELSPDVFFSGLPYAYGTVQLPQRTKAVYTIHGLREMECPVDRFEVWYARKLIDKVKRTIDFLFPGRVVAKKRRQLQTLFNQMDEADRIVAVSEHTRFSLSNHFEGIKAPVIVSYAPEKSRKPRGAPVGGAPYLLVVSGSRWVKNAVRAVLAFDDLVSRKGGELGALVMRITGGIPKRAFRKLKHPERVILMGYQSDEDLEALYADAAALLYPSLNEGFGYPPLEAMRYGTPVLTSASTSLTEVCGDAALYFDPRSAEEMQGRILAAIDRTVQKRLRASALKRYDEISRQQQRDKLALVQLLLGRPVAQ